MNKQELIERIEGLKNLFGNKSEYVEIDTVIRLISELDEPQEVEIPIFVADFITEQKKLGHTLSYSIDACMSDIVAEWYWDNSELFAFSWVNGYTVEKEKRYYVRFKGMESNDFNYLNFIKFQRAWVLSSLKIDKKFRTEHTRKQLEEAGFDWVFDCPGIEIEEVEE
nr:MAG TPA: Protein of unknown function (DUF1642) [Caudoviricetes sp.]